MIYNRYLSAIKIESYTLVINVSCGFTRVLIAHLPLFIEKKNTLNLLRG
jgi:hypothetical protein